jgi:hypothetical protein
MWGLFINVVKPKSTVKDPSNKYSSFNTTDSNDGVRIYPQISAVVKLLLLVIAVVDIIQKSMVYSSSSSWFVLVDTDTRFLNGSSSLTAVPPRQ